MFINIYFFQTSKKNVLLAKNNQLQQNRKPTAEEEAKRLRRARRFEEDAALFKAENISTPMQLMQLVKCLSIISFFVKPINNFYTCRMVMILIILL